MKLYKNVSRFRFRRRFSKGGPEERKLLWGASLKPGDVISACTGFNVKIAEIEPVRINVGRVYGARKFGYPFNGRSHGWYISDFRVTDTAGQWHYTASCCWKAETVKEIEDYWSKWDSENFPSLVREAIARMVKEGKRICDDDGLILPEVLAIQRP